MIYHLYKKTHSKETREKISQAKYTYWNSLSTTKRKKFCAQYKGKNNPMFGKPSKTRGIKLNKEQRRKVSEGMKLSYQTRSVWNKGKKGSQKHSEETRQKMREARMRFLKNSLSSSQGS